jgi:hypothetical protein
VRQEHLPRRGPLPLFDSVLCRSSISWTVQIAVSFIFALVLVALVPNDGKYSSLGPSLTLLLGLPCWLMGVCGWRSMSAQTNAPSGRSGSAGRRY